MRESNPILANFLAPLIALIPLTIISIYAWVVPDGLDDAPIKSSALFFFAFPFLYLIIVVFSYFYGKYLLSFGFIPLKKILIFTSIVTLVLSIPCAMVSSNLDKYGIEDLYFAYVSISSLILLSALPSAICWWYIACRPLKMLPNKIAQASHRRS